MNLWKLYDVFCAHPFGRRHVNLELKSQRIKQTKQLNILVWERAGMSAGDRRCKMNNSWYCVNCRSSGYSVSSWTESGSKQSVRWLWKLLLFMKDTSYLVCCGRKNWFMSADCERFSLQTCDLSLAVISLCRWNISLRD